jgi:DNA-binding MarR family transcriptional regulator
MMSDKSFFKPTNLHKEYMILDLIEKNKDITQRELASHLGIAVSMVNLLLNIIEVEGLIKRIKYTSKTVEYILTKKGIERRKLLNIMYLSSSQKLYKSAKENIEDFLFQIKNKGYFNLLLYGAGEVCELLISTINSNEDLCLTCKAIIDDDTFKLGKNLLGIPIIGLSEIELYENDALLISSYKHKDSILNNLNVINFNRNKIINFFD